MGYQHSRACSHVKLVLFSEAYRDKDLDNVLQCGQLNDEDKGDFKPAHYIIAPLCWQPLSTHHY